MPIFEPMSSDELSKMQKPKLHLDLSEYEDILQGMSVGEGGVLEPDSDESLSTIKRRLTLAAHARGFDVSYKKRGDGSLVWRLTRQESQAA